MGFRFVRRVGLVTSAVIIGVWLGMPLWTPLLTGVVQGALNERLQGTFSLEEIRLMPWGAVRLRGFSMASPKSEAPHLVVESLRLRLDVWALAGRRIRVPGLQVEGIRVNLPPEQWDDFKRGWSPREASKNPVAEKPQPPWLLEVNLQYLAVQQSQVGTATLKSLRLENAYVGVHAGAKDLRLERGSAAGYGPEVGDFETRLKSVRVRLSPSRQGVEVGDLNARAAGVVLRAQLGGTRAGAQVRQLKGLVVAEVEKTETENPQLRSWLQAMQLRWVPTPDAPLRVSLSLGRPNNPKAIAAEADLRSLWWRDRSLGMAAWTMRIEPPKVAVSALRWQLLPGEVRGRGHYRWDDGGFTGELEMRDVPIPKTAWLSAGFVSGTFTGQQQAPASNNSVRIVADLGVCSTRDRVLCDLQLVAQAAIRSDLIRLEQFQARGDDFDLSGEGKLAFSPLHADFRMTGEGSRLALPQIRSGAWALNTAVDGGWPDLRGKMAFQAQEVRWDERPAVDVDAEMTLNGSQAQGRVRARGRSAELVATAEARVLDDGVLHPELPFRGAFKVQCQQSELWLDGVSGAAEMVANVEGRARASEIAVRASMKGPEVGDAGSMSATLEGEMQGPQLGLKVDGEIDSLLKLRATSGFHTESRWAQAWLEAVPRQGDTWAPYRLEAWLSSGARSSRTPYTLRFALGPRGLHGDGGGLALRGQGAFTFDDAPFGGAGYIRITDVEVLKWLPGVASPETRVTTSVDADVQVEKGRLNVTGEVQQLDFDVSDATLSLAAPASFRYRGGYGEFSSLSLFGSAGTLRAEGHFDASAATANLTLQGALDMSWIPAFTSAVTEASGRLRFDARLAGTLDTPVLGGRVEVEETAALRLRGLANSIVVERGSLQLEEDILRVAAWSGLVGGGTFTADGAVRMVDGAPAQWDLVVTGTRLPVAYGGAKLETDADLRLRGNKSYPDVEGDIVVARGRYVQNLSVRDWFFPSSEPRLTPKMSEAPDWYHDVALRLTARHGLPIQFEFDVDRIGVDLELEADVGIGGTLALPTLSGEVRVVGGMLKFPAADLAVVDGGMRFAGALTPNPKIRFRGEGSVEASDASRYYTVVGMEGQGETLSLTLESDPPLSRLDILGLLLTGRPGAQGLLSSSAAGARGRGLQNALTVAASQLTSPLSNLATGQLRDLLGMNLALSAAVDRTQVRISLNQQLTERVIVEGVYAFDVASASSGQRLKLKFLLTDRLALQGETATVSDTTQDTLASDLKLNLRLFGE